MSEPETTIDWSIQIRLIRNQFEAALRAGETLDGMDSWLRRVPDEHQESLQVLLEQCRHSIGNDSIETRILASDAAIAAASSQSIDVGDLGHGSAVNQCKTFAGLAADASESLQTKLVQRSFPRGTTLLVQGKPATGLHLLLSGTVDIVDVKTGERIDIDGAGSVLGEMSLLTGQNCSANVVATCDVQSLTLSATDYHELKARHPEIEIALSQLVSDRLGGRNHDALCGKEIGRYRLTRCINRGGMGVVYEAQHVERGDWVALKMLRHRFIYNDAMQSRFDQEAVLLAGLRHRNVVTFQENFLAYRTRFLVLDLCDGSDLFRVLREHGALGEAGTRAVLGQIAKGLQYAHDSNVIHRDLKPGNVLVSRDGCVKLTDFGLSKLLESEVTDGKAVGTPAYMPPEQFRSGEIGPPCDWYALGCMATEMLTGRMLFRQTSWRDLYETKRTSIPTRDWPAIDASREMKNIIAGLLAPAASQRTADLEKISTWADEETVRSILVGGDVDR
ncbi:Serine/threonine-protein kinase PknH [Rubripirellula lacrimiformis]|uniref:Serine/threonine-protein kinase PknH n=1 Tax=Rubripirellula lacrimiformis TaxID=1930273 RepID=A0A517NC81_9BACT|nr:protein kinase [Rubripirellula lacrimiformis]QDT04711.1 Serine/threonine-protein kinase PknH [Rubripirellula lacrimiformis]